MLPHVSIIVPVKSEHQYIGECVASLLNLDYPDYEIIVVLDKNATKQVKQVLAMCDKKIRILQSKKRGSAANRNFGTSKASRKSKYFAFTDADCIADKQWLRSMVVRMGQLEKAEPNIGIIGGLNLVPKSDNSLAKTLGAMEQTLLGGGGSAQVAVMREEQIVHSLPNCNSMYKKKLWLQNKQDEKLIVGQDGEFNYRLSKKGNRFLAIPDAIVWHHRTNNLKGFIRRMFKYGEATARILRKHKEWEFLRIRWYGLVPVVALFVFLGLLVASPFSWPVFYTLAFCLGMYAAADILTTISVVQTTRLPYSMMCLILLPMQHSLYALGFLKGIVL